VARAQRVAEARRLQGQPAQRLERVAEAGGAVAGRALLAVDGQRHDHVARLDVVEGAAVGTHHEQPAGGVVRDGVGEADPPVGDPRVDDLERGQRDLDGGAHRVERDLVLGQVQVASQHERDLRLDPGLEQGAHRDGSPAPLAGRDVHVVEQVAEVRLVDAELGLHRLRRRADLPADHGGAVGEPTLHQALLHGIRRGEVLGADQVTDRRARDTGRLGLRESLDGGIDRGRARVLGGHVTGSRTCYSFTP